MRSKGPLRLPKLLDAERKDLRVGAPHTLTLHPCLGKRTARAFGEYGHPRRQVARRFVAGSGGAVTRFAGSRGANTGNATSLHQERRRGKPSKYVDAQRFGLLRQPTHNLANGGYVVAMILHGGRHRHAHRPLLGEHVHALFAHRPAKRKFLVRKFGKELSYRARINNGPGKTVLPDFGPPFPIRRSPRRRVRHRRRCLA